MIHLLIPCRMNLRSKTVLVYFACLKNFTDAHFGQFPGRGHSMVLFAEKTFLDFWGRVKERFKFTFVFT